MEMQRRVRKEGASRGSTKKCGETSREKQAFLSSSFPHMFVFVLENQSEACWHSNPCGKEGGGEGSFWPLSGSLWWLLLYLFSLSLSLDVCWSSLFTFLLWG